MKRVGWRDRSWSVVVRNEVVEIDNERMDVGMRGMVVWGLGKVGLLLEDVVVWEVLIMSNEGVEELENIGVEEVEVIVGL